MSIIQVAIDIPAKRSEVWDRLADISSHVEWMADAAEITFLSENESGLGTEFECLTKVGPLRTTDRMLVTEWESGSRMAVRHLGLFTGEGRFVLTDLPDGSGTRVTWMERLSFPWYFGAALGASVAKPVLRAIWRGNLRRFSNQVTDGQ